MFTAFELKNLHQLEGGKVAQAFNKHVARASSDCYDRPGDSKPRVVLLQIEIIPVQDQHGNCDDVLIHVQTTSKVPPHRTNPINARLGTNGVLKLNLDSPDDVDQGSLPYHRDDD